MINKCMEDFKNGTFISYQLTNTSAAKLVEWAKAEGLNDIVPAEKLHVTVVWTKKIIPKYELIDDIIRLDPFSFSMNCFGDAIVIEVFSNQLNARYEYSKTVGAVHTYPYYRPHITISYDKSSNTDLIEKLGPPKFAIYLEKETATDLSEQIEEVDEGLDPKRLEILLRAGLVKRDMIQKAVRALKDPKASVTVPELRVILIDILGELLQFVGNHKEIFLRLKNRLLKDDNINECFEEMISETTRYVATEEWMRVLALEENMPLSQFKEKILNNSVDANTIHYKVKQIKA